MTEAKYQRYNYTHDKDVVAQGLLLSRELDDGRIEKFGISLELHGDDTLDLWVTPSQAEEIIRQLEKGLRDYREIKVD